MNNLKKHGSIPIINSEEQVIKKMTDGLSGDSRLMLNYDSFLEEYEK